MTDVKLRESSKLGHLDLDDLPAKVANVQTELQQLDEATQQVRQKVRQAEQASQQSHVSEQLLEQQIEQDLAIVQTLQMRQADLLALKTAQGQRPKRCNKAAVLQDKHKAARQQLKHVNASFEAICNKFQDRFQSETMESTAAATADELSKLEDEGLAAHQKYCQQQQLAREEAELLEQGQQKLLSLRLATDEKQRQCDKEDKQLEQLKAALAKAGLPGEARAISESNKRIETQVQACKDRTAGFKREIARLQADHLNQKKQNDRMELEIGTLQTALHALSSSCHGPQEPATRSHAAAAPQPDTGVFGPQPPATVASMPSSAGTSTHTSFRNVTPLQTQQTQQKTAPLAPLARQRQAARFQYPEDTPSPAEHAKGQHQTQQTPRNTSSQHAHHSSAPGHAHAAQPAAYTVEEPDSPAQPTGSAAQSGAHKAPCRGTGSGARGPPAGCLYEDTTIRRVITPLKNGKPSGAWAHHEEITVRQVRQINQSEARLHSLPPPLQPHVVQASEVKEYHCGGKGHADAAPQQPRRAPFGHISGGWSGMGTSAADRTHSEDLATESAAATFAAYNPGGVEGLGGEGPTRRQGQLPSTRGRGRKSASGSRPLSTAKPRPRMKRLFPDDEELALPPTDEEIAARRRQEEDDMDAELFVNIGSSHV